MNPDSRAAHPPISPRLRRLESEAVSVLRDAVARFSRPVLLYSVGKDSSVLLHLAIRAFHPARPPFPILHVDTTWKFREMIAFRDEAARRAGVDLVVHVNEDGLRRGVSPVASGSSVHTRVMKTEALRQAIDAGRYDVAIGGARRDEERSRSKERIFSVRSATHGWDPRDQRPEPWRLLNARLRGGQTMRAFPLSDWTEVDVWDYVAARGIDVVSLYFAKPRPVVARGGVLVVVDDDRLPLHPGESPRVEEVRFRTLGCYPLTGAIRSRAADVAAVAAEVRASSLSERQGRLVDADEAFSMERRKKEGYF